MANSVTVLEACAVRTPNSCANTGRSGSQIRNEVELAHATAVDAKTRLEAFERSERRAKQWASKIQSSVDLGTEDEKTLVEPLRAYATARINRLQATYDYVAALSQLVFVTGWEPDELFQ